MAKWCAIESMFSTFKARLNAVWLEGQWFLIIHLVHENAWSLSAYVSDNYSNLCNCCWFDCLDSHGFATLCMDAHGVSLWPFLSPNWSAQSEHSGAPWSAGGLGRWHRVDRSRLRRVTMLPFKIDKTLANFFRSQTALKTCLDKARGHQRNHIKTCTCCFPTACSRISRRSQYQVSKACIGLQWCSIKSRSKMISIWSKMGAPLTFGYLWHIKAQVGIYWSRRAACAISMPLIPSWQFKLETWRTQVPTCTANCLKWLKDWTALVRQWLHMAKSFRKGKCGWEAPAPSPVRSQRPPLLWGYLGAWSDTHKRGYFRWLWG